MVQISQEPTRRRPTQARSIATRSQLVESAAAVLVERGDDGLTTNEVAARAGVSRGALLHHFPSRAALVAAAVEHLLDRRAAELRQRIRAIDDAAGVEEILVALWPAFEDATFGAWAQLWVAARTDDQLAELLVAVDRRFTESTREDFAALTAEHGVTPATAALVRDLLFALLVGLGFQRMLERERRPVEEYFGVAARAAAMLLGDSA